MSWSVGTYNVMECWVFHITLHHDDVFVSFIIMIVTSIQLCIAQTRMQAANLKPTSPHLAGQEPCLRLSSALFY
jgi:hypothetical protein